METIRTISPDLLQFTAVQFKALAPFLCLLIGSMVALLFCTMERKTAKWPVFWITLLTCALGIYYSRIGFGTDTTTLFNGMMVIDAFSSFFFILVLSSVIITTLVSFRYLDLEDLQHPEYYVLLIFSAFGMMTMVATLDLVTIFIALELMSLAVYILVGFRRSDRKSNEASVKYFILGGAASAVFLYGVALLYGATGTTNISSILLSLSYNSGQSSALYTLGAWLVMAGFLFKVASVPFHMWMPDVYEGAPAPITGFMTTGLKAASFAVLIRVFMMTGYGGDLNEGVADQLHDLIWVCAVLTMIVGNVIALTQTNLKRMLAYSSIAHTGYILVGLLAGSFSGQGYSAVVIYLVGYTIMNLGAFAVLTAIAGRSDHGLNLQDLSGLSKRHPLLALSLAVFLFSMAGIPPTVGFISKYLIFYSAIQAGEIWLVVIGVLCSAISVYYYLRVLVYMYMRDPVGEPSYRGVPFWVTVSLAVTVFLTIQLGLLPQTLLDTAKTAITGL